MFFQGFLPPPTLLSSYIPALRITKLRWVRANLMAGPPELLVSNFGWIASLLFWNLNSLFKFPHLLTQRCPGLLSDHKLSSLLTCIFTRNCTHLASSPPTGEAKTSLCLSHLSVCSLSLHAAAHKHTCISATFLSSYHVTLPFPHPILEEHHIHSVSWWSLALIQCQQEPLTWGAVKKETLVSAKQLRCDRAQLWGQYGCSPALGPRGAGAGPLSSRRSTLLGPLPVRFTLRCSALRCSLLWRDVFGISAQPERCSLQWEGKVYSKTTLSYLVFFPLSQSSRTRRNWRPLSALFLLEKVLQPIVKGKEENRECGFVSDILSNICKCSPYSSETPVIRFSYFDVNRLFSQLQ